jgi:hypothetical protein
VFIAVAELQDFANLEYSENMTEVHLIWLRGPASEEVLPFLKKWRHLRRLTFSKWNSQCDMPLKALCDFIMEMKHLTYLNIGPKDSNSDQLLRAKVNELVLPRRPNFKFCTSRIQILEK